MNLKTYYHQLSRDQKRQFCLDAGTSTEYVRIHLIPKKGMPDRVPRAPLILACFRASQGNVSYTEVLEHFHHQNLSQTQAA